MQEQELALTGFFVGGRQGSTTFHVGQLARQKASVYCAPLVRQLEANGEEHRLGLCLPKLRCAGGGGMAGHPVKWAACFKGGANTLWGESCFQEAPRPKDGINGGGGVLGSFFSGLEAAVNHL